MTFIKKVLAAYVAAAGTANLFIASGYY